MSEGSVTYPGSGSDTENKLQTALYETDHELANMDINIDVFNDPKLTNMLANIMTGFNIDNDTTMDNDDIKDDNKYEMSNISSIELSSIKDSDTDQERIFKLIQQQKNKHKRNQTELSSINENDNDSRRILKLMKIQDTNNKLDTFKINLQVTATETITLETKVTKYSTTKDVKDIILNELNKNDIILQVNGEDMQDNLTLNDYNINDSRHLIRMIVKVKDSSKVFNTNKVFIPPPYSVNGIIGANQYNNHWVPPSVPAGDITVNTYTFRVPDTREISFFKNITLDLSDTLTIYDVKWRLKYHAFPAINDVNNMELTCNGNILNQGTIRQHVTPHSDIIQVMRKNNDQISSTGNCCNCTCCKRCWRQFSGWDIWLGEWYEMVGGVLLIVFIVCNIALDIAGLFHPYPEYCKSNRVMKPYLITVCSIKLVCYIIAGIHLYWNKWERIIVLPSIWLFCFIAVVSGFILLQNGSISDVCKDSSVFLLFEWWIYYHFVVVLLCTVVFAIMADYSSMTNTEYLGWGALFIVLTSITMDITAIVPLSSKWSQKPCTNIDNIYYGKPMNIRKYLIAALVSKSTFLVPVCLSYCEGPLLYSLFFANCVEFIFGIIGIRMIYVLDSIPMSCYSSKLGVFTQIWALYHIIIPILITIGFIKYFRHSILEKIQPIFIASTVILNILLIVFIPFGMNVNDTHPCTNNSIIILVYLSIILSYTITFLIIFGYTFIWNYSEVFTLGLFDIEYPGYHALAGSCAIIIGIIGIIIINLPSTSNECLHDTSTGILLQISSIYYLVSPIIVLLAVIQIFSYMESLPTICVYIGLFAFSIVIMIINNDNCKDSNDKYMGKPINIKLYLFISGLMGILCVISGMIIYYKFGWDSDELMYQKLIHGILSLWGFIGISIFYGTSLNIECRQTTMAQFIPIWSYINIFLFIVSIFMYIYDD